MPQVTVCIPTRNRARDLSVRLGELRAQTWEDFEIVVVDDASDDATATVATDAMRLDSRVRYVRFEEPIGVPDIFERCFAEARADLVAIFHDHDSYRVDAVERLAAALAAVPEAAFAFTGVRTIHPTTGDVLDVSSDSIAPQTRTDVATHFVTTGSSMVGASAALIRRDRLPRSPYNHSLGLFADVELWCRLALAAPVAYDPGPLVDVVGWTESESLAKLNWRMIGLLADLRRNVANNLAAGPAQRIGMTARISASTAKRRMVWTERMVRHAAMTNEDLSAGLAGAPIPVRAVVLAARGTRRLRGGAVRA
jgi:glycosyltransferase involved in cell wall biosynthesis